MHMSRIIARLGLAKLSDQQLDDYAQNKVDSITGNVNFPTPAPSLESVSAAMDLFHKAVSKALTGNVADTADKNAKRVILEGLLIQLAAYCAFTSNGSIAMYLTSGFDYKRAAAPSGILPSPQNFLLKRGANDGQVKASWKLIDNNHGYELRWSYDNVTPDAMTNWAPCSSTRFTLSGLQTGKRLYAFVHAVGSHNTSGDWSDVSSITV